ncbi:MAG: hypothetical protein PWP65_558 [Clostridia bacterium]|nr:hypothetical protein [Clostridia bacterium]
MGPVISLAAIVTDARYRMSLAVIRSLGRAGIQVTAAEDNNTPREAILGFASRYATRQALLPPAGKDPDAFIAALLALSPSHEVLIPITLKTILAVADHYTEVSRKLGVAVASPESLRTANDTQKLLSLAEAVGVPIPKTTTIKPGEDLQTLANRLTFPLVVKYRAGEELNLPPQKRYAIIPDRRTFLGTFPEMHARQPFPLIQEYVPGRGFGTSVIFDRRRRPVAIFQHRRLREYPVTGGPSCLCESVIEPRAAEYAVRLLKELEWYGVAMVEFKQDAEGEFRLMEINPRFWGSLPLAPAAGVDFPFILYRVARGEDVTPVTTYRTGVRMRYLFQDLFSVPGYLRRNENKLGFLVNFARDLLDREIVDGVFARDDPGPGRLYLKRSLMRFLSRSEKNAL